MVYHLEDFIDEISQTCAILVVDQAHLEQVVELLLVYCAAIVFITNLEEP